MYVIVLGSAAGGGFPQWNCGCLNCEGFRAGTVLATARTQDSVAISADREHWYLLNASPDILGQIQKTRALSPRAARHSPIAGIVLTNGDLDHTLGLFSLRESYPLSLYATGTVSRGLEGKNAMFRTLRRFPTQATWHALVIGEMQSLLLPDGGPSGLTITPFAAKGKRPVHLEGEGAPSAEDNVGIRITSSTGKTLIYLTAAATVSGLEAELSSADVLLFDGSFWSSDELISQGLGVSYAEDMAHLPIGGDGGSLVALAGVATPRKIFTHINNTNPILRSDSKERALVESAGWEIAEDGMEFSL